MYSTDLLGMRGKQSVLELQVTMYMYSTDLLGLRGKHMAPERVTDHLHVQYTPLMEHVVL